MMAEILMAGVIGLSAGVCVGYVAKHIQDTKYLNDMAKFSEVSVKNATKKACKKMAAKDREVMELMLNRISYLERENARLRHPDFFEVPSKIKTDSKLIFEDRTV